MQLIKNYIVQIQNFNYVVTLVCENNTFWYIYERNLMKILKQLLQLPSLKW